MSELVQIGAPNQRPRIPDPSEVEMRFSEKAVAELEVLKTHYPEEKACILPALWIAQREYGGHLPGEALAEVALRLKRSYAEIEGVATFYSMFTTGHKPGKHKIEVCTCLTCSVCGAHRIFDYLKQKLHVDADGLSADGVFTIEEVECLDACDRAPVLQVGDEYIGPVDEKAVHELLEKLRNTPEPTTIKLADEIVQVHLTATEIAHLKGQEAGAMNAQRPE